MERSRGSLTDDVALKPDTKTSDGGGGSVVRLLLAVLLPFWSD